MEIVKMGLGGDTLSQINKTLSRPVSLREDNIGSAVSKILHHHTDRQKHRYPVTFI